MTMTTTTDVGLLTAICGGFFVPFLFSAYFAFHLLRKSQFSYCWNGIRKNSFLLILEHSINCTACFPKAKKF